VANEQPHLSGPFRLLVHGQKIGWRKSCFGCLLIRKIAVPCGQTRFCPVKAVKDWMTQYGRSEGFLFVAINKYENLVYRQLSGEAVSQIIKTRADQARFDPCGYSGHSLRAGFATFAALAGATTHDIRRITGYQSDASLARYIRDVDLFRETATWNLF
jgi:hypothetical protein